MSQDSSSTFDPEIRRAALRMEWADDEALEKEHLYAEENKINKNSFLHKLVARISRNKRESQDERKKKTLYELLNEKTPELHGTAILSLRERRDELHGRGREERRQLIRDEIQKIRENIREQQGRGFYIQAKFFSLIENEDISRIELISAFKEDNLSIEERQLIESIFDQFSERKKELVWLWKCLFGEFSRRTKASGCMKKGIYQRVQKRRSGRKYLGV